MIPSSTSFLSVLVFFLLCSSFSDSHAQTSIVSPGSLTQSEGNQGSNNFVPGQAFDFRVQYVIPAVDFLDRGVSSAQKITEVAIRFDSLAPGPGKLTFEDAVLIMATVPTGFVLGTSMADNLAAASNVEQFFVGDLVYTSHTSNGIGTLQDFAQVEYVGDLTPYKYDPTLGNLLYDFRSTGGLTNGPTLQADGTSLDLLDATAPVFGQRDGDVAEVSAGTTVFRITTVPEPSGIVGLLIGGLWALHASRPSPLSNRRNLSRKIASRCV